MHNGLVAFLIVVLLMIFMTGVLWILAEDARR